MADTTIPPQLPFLKTASLAAEDVAKARADGKLTNKETVEMVDLLSGLAAGTTELSAFQTRFVELTKRENDAVRGVEEKSLPAIAEAFEKGFSEAKARLGSEATDQQLRQATITELSALDQALTGTTSSAAVSVDSSGEGDTRYGELFASGGGGGGGGGGKKAKGDKVQNDIEELNNIWRLITKKRIPDFANKTKPGNSMEGIPLIGPERAKEMVKAAMK
jgi:hypothetical protein